MNPDPHRLLDEILGEAAPAEFRSAVLKQTLRRVRRRRVARKAQRGLMAAALLVSLPVLVWRTIFVPHHDIRAGFPKIAVVSSQPPAPSMLVESKLGSVRIVASSTGVVALVSTVRRSDSVKEITDEELLALTAGRPAVLVRQSPRQAELFFVHAEDQNGFPVH